jgi:SpoIID/LytB domain protein
MSQSYPRSQIFLFLAFAVATAIPWLQGGSALAQDTLLRVGVVQRFGEAKEKDEITLGSTTGDTLTLRFTDSQGQTKTLQTPKALLEVIEQPTDKAFLEERLVLSDHATFETAEDSAKRWQALGIKVEITQPGRWQVWAKRSVYPTPLVRRWLLASLKAQGYSQPYLDSKILTSQPQVTLTVNQNRYTPKNLEVASGKNLIQVTLEKQPLRLYGGSLVLQPNAYGNYTLVNHVPLEVYLRGVVPHEIGHEAPESATKAQTIIARTYALRNLRRFQSDNYQLCADIHCQVYYGLVGTNARADQAIAATRGLVLTYGNELVDALYSSTTGGITAPFTDVWDGQERPYLRSVIDSPQGIWDLSKESLADEDSFRRFIGLKEGFNETGRKVFRWKYEAPLTDLNKDLQTYLTRRKHPLANFSTIVAMAVTKRSPSGRILVLTVQTDKGQIDLYKNEARSAFSPPRSTLFYVEPMFDEKQQLKGYAFIGGGFGHGVGLSQFGSYNLARLGWSADRILSFYYPGTKIQPLNNSVVLWKE